MSGVYEIRLGAIYKFASKEHLDRSAVTSLLTERLGLKPELAVQLCGHWFTTEKFKQAMRGLDD